jgi:hypothetical protein
MADVQDLAGFHDHQQPWGVDDQLSKSGPNESLNNGRVDARAGQMIGTSG